MLAYILLLVPMPPLAGFGLLALYPHGMSRRMILAAALAAGCAPLAVILPMALAYLTGLIDAQLAPIFTLNVGDYAVAMAMGLDAISAVGAVTVALITACVMVYAVYYMSNATNADLRRFYALMNLFAAGMLAMVLAADSIVLFLGWELMGLCSFFLIAYRMTSPRAFAAGRKALIMTRIADAALLSALLLAFLEASSVRLDILIPAAASPGSHRGALIAALLLVGALGKSAQIPFQTWLPTAMAGPTPVSALLHSATMVAAGAVLLVRFAPVIGAYPGPAAATAIAGVSTALFGALCAVAQTDVKRLLAYSSISQIGFMVLAVGIGAPGAAMAHFVMHAIFKSLLFMASGVMSNSTEGDTAIDSLRGARTAAPVAFWSFTAGAASLAGLPLVTAGWWSKEAIFAAAFHGDVFSALIGLVALGAASLTGVYAFRPVLIAARHGPDGPIARVRQPWSSNAPLILLAVLAILAGVFANPIAAAIGGAPPHAPALVALLGAAAAIGGIVGSYYSVYSPPLAERIRRARRLRAGMQMDAVYYATFVRPYRRLVRQVTGRNGRIINILTKPARRAFPDPVAGLGDRAARAASAPADRGPPDPVGAATVAIGLWFYRTVTGFVTDGIDLAWAQGATWVDRAARRARRLQTGRARDYALFLAFGIAALLTIAWWTTWH